MDPTSPSPQPHRTGYLGLLGRPNVGKSTLLNRVLGQKVSITSPKPQTTRNRIVGIWTGPDAQVLLVDTPGIHAAFTPLNQAMVSTAWSVLSEVDAVAWIVDATEGAARIRRGEPVVADGEEEAVARLEGADLPILLVPNKVDAIEPPFLLPLIDAWRSHLDLAACVPISAKTGLGVGDLLQEATRLMPEGPALFPEDQLVEQPERFVVAEIVREKIILRTEREIPYATAVEVEEFDESQRDGDRPFVRISARIIVERPSQKGILIGKGGSMLKRIGTEARKDIENLLGARVHLALFVAVEPDWSSRPRFLKEFQIG